MTVGSLNAAEEPRVGLSALFAVLARRARWIALVSVTFGVAGFIVAKLNRRWSVEATIKPQGTDRSNSRLSGLAAQLGVVLPGSPIGDPVRFYAELLQSREVLLQAVRAPRVVPTGEEGGDTLRGSFLDLYEIDGTNADERARRGRERLRKAMLVTTDRDAGFVRIRLTTKWPSLSMQLGQDILRLTNAASIAKQRQQAEAERAFVEGRMLEAQRALEAAENALERFQASNRSYSSSPVLTTRFGRLQRQVDMRQQVYASLAQSYEQARLDEVRDTPVLMVVDGLEGSLRGARRASRDAILWLIAGGVLSSLVLIGADGVGAMRRRRVAPGADLATEPRSELPRRRHG